MFDTFDWRFGCGFDCGYINKPYCSLRPFNNIPSCPKFSCPPPLGCHNPSFFPHQDFCSPFRYCCPPFCQPNPPCQPCFPRFPKGHCPPFCQPDIGFPGCHQPCNTCFSPLNLLWFCGGLKCGQRRSPCGINQRKSRDFLKEFLNEKTNF